MKRLRWPILVLLAVLSLFRVVAQPANSAGVPPLEIADSPNRKFRVVVEAVGDSINELQATMLKTGDDSRVALWVTRIPYFRRPIGSPNIYVSNNGDFFVRITSVMGDISLFRKDPKSVVIHEYSGLNPISSLLYNLENRMPAAEMLRGEEVLRLWDLEQNRWSVYSTKNGAKFHPSHEDILRWNEATRQEILNRLHDAKREELRQKAKNISAPLARLAGPPTTNAAPRNSDYEFLAAVRNPDDRKWFEALFEKKTPAAIQQRIQFLRGDAASQPYFFQQTESERAHADWLLAYFDNKVTWQERGAYWAYEFGALEQPRYNLGKVTGTIRLPMPMPIYRNSTQATLLHIRLIHAEDADKKQPAAEEERIAARIGYERGRDRREVYNVKFAFTTVLPGTYHLKAVWDKRRPLSDTNNAGPGDYESALSAPFTVKAGATTTNVLFCTNRIAGGEAYYDADEILERQWLAENPAAPPQ